MIFFFLVPIFVSKPLKKGFTKFKNEKNKENFKVYEQFFFFFIENLGTKIIFYSKNKFKEEK